MSVKESNFMTHESLEGRSGVLGACSSCSDQRRGNCSSKCCQENNSSRHLISGISQSGSPGGKTSDRTGLLSQTAGVGTVQSTYGSFAEVRPGHVRASSDVESLTSLESSDSIDTSEKNPLMRPQRGDMVFQNSSDDRRFVVRTPNREAGLENSVRCDCHVKVVDHTTRKAVIKLVLAAVIALFFMVGEMIGGYFAHSLAIMTDAAHMLSDFASFLISLFAIWVARRPPSSGMSFGWYRAEVIGAIVSVLIIWVLTGILVYEAVLRVIHRNFTVDPQIMLITACAGLFVNVFMCMVLHQHSHGHGGHGHGGGSGQDQGESGNSKEERRQRKKNSTANINVHAAFIHVLGDLLQSIGVIIAGYIIYFTGWVLVDPICTFLFCILVIFSTLNVLKDTLRVVMEGTPKHLDYEEVKNDLNKVDGVKQAHSLHIWSITLNRTALAAHLALEPGADTDTVLDRASAMLKRKHSITQSTLQVEGYKQVMNECGTCQEPQRASFLHSLVPSFLIRKNS